MQYTVLVLSGCGPATVYGPRAFAAFREFYAEHAAHSDGQQPAR